MERARRAEALLSQEVGHHELVDAAAGCLAAREERLAAKLGQLRHEVGEQDEVPFGARQHHLAAVLAHRLQDVLGISRVARQRRLHLDVAERERRRDVGRVGADDRAATMACDCLAERGDHVNAQPDARQQYIHAPPPSGDCQPPASPLYVPVREKMVPTVRSMMDRSNRSD